MDPIVELALAKVAEKRGKAVRKDVAAGKYPIDTVVSLHLSGLVTVEPDGTYSPTTSIPWKTALALFVRYSGVTREHALQALTLAMREALDKDEEAEELISAFADLDEAAERVQEALGELPEQPRKGAVRVKVQIKEAA